MIQLYRTWHSFTAVHDSGLFLGRDSVATEEAEVPRLSWVVLRRRRGVGTPAGPPRGSVNERRRETLSLSFHGCVCVGKTPFGPFCKLPFSLFSII